MSHDRWGRRDGARPEESVQVGSVLALGIAVLATAVLTGAVAGVPGGLTGLAAGTGAVGAGAALRALVRESNRSRAVGSLGLVVSGATMLGAIGGLFALATGVADAPTHPLADVGDAAVLALATAGVLAASTDAFVDSPAAAASELGAVVRRSGAVLIVGALVAYLASVGVFTDGPLAVLSVGAELLEVAAEGGTRGGAALFASVVALQALAVVTLWLVRVAVSTVEQWLSHGGEEDDGVGRLLAVLPDPAELPAGVWVALAVQVVTAVFLTRAVGGLTDAIVDALGPLGVAVRVAVSTGLLHWPLVGLAALAGGVLVAERLRRLFVRLAGRSPPTTLAFAAGGIGGVAVAWTLGAIVIAVEVIARPTETVGHAVAPGVAVALVVGLLAVGAAAVVPGRVGRVVGVNRASGFAAGAAALFVAGLFVAVYGLGGVVRRRTVSRVGASVGPSAVEPVVPVAAVVGVAASVLVWDLGENAVSLQRQLGPEAETREVELTHAVASTLVAGGSVVLATVTYYLLGPLLFGGVDVGPVELSDGLVTVGPERALVGVGLAFVALFAFAVLLNRGREPGPK